ncbi:ImmA/IrrE family metallo-endopeptidase [Nocardia fluminea]|uniref:ImmA/IrrE family metallo-endopeptidase n=1 Tax=Nocardia fluminea TaxID=134984 RepID=UPI00365B6615
MQWYLGPEGDQRIWYEPTEIARIAEDELRRASLMPTPSSPVTDLERFIEVHLKAALDQYADLPDGVLGVTQFAAGRPPMVSINGKLTESVEVEDENQGLLGRWRATLAHEASHVLFHRYLFEPEMAQLVAGSRAPDGSALQRAGAVRCLHRDVAPTSTTEWKAVRRRSDWKEVQANRGMAALLMPERVFTRVAYRQASQASDNRTAFAARSTLLASAMARIFNVSKQAAEIRLNELGVTPTASD